MKTLTAGWRAFWSGPITPEGLGLSRILLGLCLLGYFLLLLPHVALLFSREGVYVPLLLPDWAPPPAAAFTLYAATLLLLLLFTAGLWTRLVAPLCLLAFTYHLLLNIAVRNTAYDRLIFLLLLLCAVAPLDAAFSPGRPRRPIPAFTVRLLQLQLALLYLGSGLWKLLSPAWHTGEMLRMTLCGPWATDLAFRFVAVGWPGWFYSLLTFGTIAFELGAGFALFHHRLRLVVMGLGLGFHVAIALLLSIPQFLVCPALYPLFLWSATLPAPTGGRPGPPAHGPGTSAGPGAPPSPPPQAP